MTKICRPKLDKDIENEDFAQHYWLKEELATFCRQLGIRAHGSKDELKARISLFLFADDSEAGMISQRPKRRPRKVDHQPNLDDRLTEDYTNNQTNRKLFESAVGPSFHFTTRFMQYCRNNPEKTYRDAVTAWFLERDEKKRGEYRPEIGRQFEYNRFIREYFQTNPGKSLREAVEAWWTWRRKS